VTASASSSQLYAHLGRPSRVWTYHGSDGGTLGAVLRWDRPHGEKEIRPARRDPDGTWHGGAMAAPRPLYRLPVLLSRPDVPVLVTEGEKAADAAGEALGGLAVVTTWAGGSGAVSQTAWSSLRGRAVRVWPDADAAGAEAGRKVVAHAYLAGASGIERLTLPEDWPRGHDAADLEPEDVVRLWLDALCWRLVDVGNALARARDGSQKYPHNTRRIPSRDLLPTMDVGRAKTVSVVEIARGLGLGEPVRRGSGELRVLCPLHEDHDPSLRIAPDGRGWFCDPCGEGGDAIRLWMRARRVGFRQAVEELVGSVGAPGQKRAVLPQLFGEPCPGSE